MLEAFGDSTFSAWHISLGGGGAETQLLHGHQSIVCLPGPSLELEMLPRVQESFFFMPLQLERCEGSYGS